MSIESNCYKVLDHLFSATLYNVYDYNRDGEVEVSYDQLESAFEAEYGQSVGHILSSTIPDIVDVEQFAHDFERACHEYVA